MASKTSYELPTFGDSTELALPPSRSQPLTPVSGVSVSKREQGKQTAPPAPEYLEKAKTWIVPSSDFWLAVRILVNYYKLCSDRDGHVHVFY